MDSKPKLPSSSREMRNIAEKMRRDKLNNYVSELASIVPLVCGSSKRIDKTSVLRLAANFIRMHNILGDGEDDEKPPPTSGPVHRGFMNSLEEAIGGFLLVVTSSGKVVFITEAVESFFGYSQVDLLGNSIYTVVHPEDHEIVREQLNSKDESRRSFFCRMLEKALSRNDPNRYEIIHIVGTLKPLPERWPSSEPTPNYNTGTCESTESNDDTDSEEDEQQAAVSAANRIGTHMLVAFVRVVKDRPITELSLVESTQDEYITRHTMDGKILYTDHRISFVTGLMPTEVIGTSAFKYMHTEDMVWSMVAHKLMFTSTQGQGLVSYRLKCKGGTLVTLRSRGYIELNKQTGQPETFVCINTVVSNKDSNNEIKTQRRKLLPMIAGENCEDHLSSVSSMMPPELMSMMKQLMDPNTIQKMIAEVDPGRSLAGDMLKDEPHDDLATEGHQQYPGGGARVKQRSVGTRKRNSRNDMCALPPKIQNQSNTCKPIADVYHQSYSPQDPVPLPSLSPDTVQPLLCTSSPSLASTPSPLQALSSPCSTLLPQEDPYFTQHNKYLQSSNSSHMSGESDLKMDTSVSPPLLNDNYQGCRQCNKVGSNPSRHSLDQSPGFHPHDISDCLQSTRITKLSGAYQCQNSAETVNASPVPQCGQDQMPYPHYIGSTNGQGTQNCHIHPHPYTAYPHSYTDTSYRTNLSCYSSVPEFDIKLQRHQQQQLESHHFHQAPNLSQPSHYLSHQRTHAQQNWLARSMVSHSGDVMGATSPIAGAISPEAFHNIPHQGSPLSGNHQGTSFP